MSGLFKTSLTRDDLLQYWSTQVEGERATDSGAFCLGRDGSVFVADSLNRNVKKFDQNGQLNLVIGGNLPSSLSDKSVNRGAAVQSSGFTPLRNPQRVCTVHGRQIAVADAAANRIFIVDASNGELLYSISDQNLKSPVAVAEHKTSKQLVVVTLHGQCFLVSLATDGEGVKIRHIDDNKAFERVSSCTVSSNNRTVTSVKVPPRLNVSNSSLTTWETIDLNAKVNLKDGALTSIQNSCSPSGVCFDADGYLYVCDVNNNRIIVFDGKVDYVTEIHTRDWFEEAQRFSLDDELRMTLRGPRDVSVNQQGHLVVLDQSGMVKTFCHKVVKASRSCEIL